MWWVDLIAGFLVSCIGFGMVVGVLAVFDKVDRR